MAQIKAIAYFFIFKIVKVFHRLLSLRDQLQINGARLPQYSDTGTESSADSIILAEKELAGRIHVAAATAAAAEEEVRRKSIAGGGGTQCAVRWCKYAGEIQDQDQ